MKPLFALVFFFSSITVFPSSTRNKSDASDNDSTNIGKTLQVSYVHPDPVITVKSKGAEGIKFGFEGGRVVKVNGTYKK